MERPGSSARPSLLFVSCGPGQRVRGSLERSNDSGVLASTFARRWRPSQTDI